MLPALLLGLVLVAPPATAAYDDTHADLRLTLHEDDVVDVRLVTAVEGESRADLEHGGDNECSATGYPRAARASSRTSFQIDELDSMPACDIRVPGLSLSDTEEFLTEDMTVTHSDGTYTVVFEEDFFGSTDDPRLTVEFPGGVESASAGGSIDGNTVTWDSVGPGDELRAVGADTSGTSLVWILLGVVGAVVVVAGLTSLVLVRRSGDGAAALVHQPRYVVPGTPGPVPVTRQAGQPQAGLQPQPGWTSTQGAAYGPVYGSAHTVAQPGGSGQAPPAAGRNGWPLGEALGGPPQPSVPSAPLPGQAPGYGTCPPGWTGPHQ